MTAIMENIEAWGVNGKGSFTFEENGMKFYIKENGGKNGLINEELMWRGSAWLSDRCLLIVKTRTVERACELLAYYKETTNVRS